MMSNEPTAVSGYVQQFEAAGDRLPGGGWLAEARRVAINRFASLGFPGRKMEEWKYADLRPLSRTAYTGIGDTDGVTAETVEAHAVPGLDPICRLVFVNGRFMQPVSKLSGLPQGLQVRSLREMLMTGGGILRDTLLGLGEDDAFVQLNTALMRDGAVILLEPGVTIDRPLELLFIGGGAEGAASHLRTVIRAGAGAALNMVETYSGMGEEACFTNSVTQILLAADARLELTRRQQECPAAAHIGRTFLDMDKAQATITALSTGGLTARHELRATFNAGGGHLDFNGVQLSSGKQALDTLTLLDHAVPETSSNQVYRGVLAGQSTASFQGKVRVRRNAQHTDAQQHSASLLLERGATANAKPELEIFADDVKCAHGSTVGEMDPAQIFYLMARGLARAEAESLLTEAFIAEPIAGISDPAVREACLADARSWVKTTRGEKP